jgi:hypothetical protein
VKNTNHWHVLRRRRRRRRRRIVLHILRSSGFGNKWLGSNGTGNSK